MNKREANRITETAMNLRAFEYKEYWMEQLEKWVYVPKEKRKLAVFQFTASHERNIGYRIEELEAEVKRLTEMVGVKND